MGVPADLGVLEAMSLIDGLLDRAPRRHALKAGRVVAETTRAHHRHYGRQRGHIAGAPVRATTGVAG